MAATIEQVRSGLVTAIQASAVDHNGHPLPVGKRVNEQVNGPQAWVKIPSGSYEQTMGSLDRKRMRAEIELLVPVAGGADNAQRIMDSLLSNTGSGSVHAAIAEDRYLGGRAAQFTSASSEYLSIVDNASLSGGDIALWGSVWFYPDTSTGQMVLMAKGNTDVSANCEYYFFARANNTISLIVGNGAGANGQVSTTDTFTDKAWNHGVWWHDPVSNTININLNNGTAVSTAYTTGSHDSGAAFHLGSDVQTLGSYFNGRQQSASFGKPSAAISGISTALNTALYNSGNPPAYDQLVTLPDGAGIVSYWNLDEESGTRYDSHGGNHLTDNNSVTSAAGKGRVCYAQCPGFRDYDPDQVTLIGGQNFLTATIDVVVDVQ